MNSNALLKEGVLGGNLVLCTRIQWTHVQQGPFRTSLPLMSLV